MAFSLNDRVAIVYGGSYGIGKGISQVLAKAGAHVVIVARNKGKGEETLKQLKGEKHKYIQADVSKFEDHDRITNDVIKEYNRIDIIVCCAGIYSPEYELDDPMYTQYYVDNMIDVNLKGSIHALRSTLPFLKNSPYGRVILISSITGHSTGMPGFTVYGATKSAQVGFARSAAVELAKHQITVNCVCPGNILTEGLENLGQTYIDSMVKSIPLARLGTPADIGNTVLFLASSEASFITGQEITVDGGQTRPESLIN